MGAARISWALSLALFAVTGWHGARASDAPKWMHALAGAQIPAHDDKTRAAVLLSEISITVMPNGTIKRLERKAYKILRPEGADLGKPIFVINGQTRITDLHAWCIPETGKDYEVKRRDSVEAGLGVENGLLVTDIRGVGIQIPAAAPGNIIGYEIEEELTPYVYSDDWRFQETLPVREAHYSLELPSGWDYKATWLNHPDETPTTLGQNHWQWNMSDVPAIALEPRMQPWIGIAGNLYLALIPPSAHGRSIQSWSDLGVWYDGLTQGKREPSAEIKQKAIELTASASTLFGKMQALASFVQEDIRYVGIELGIGGYQPHPAPEVFAHRYGDCKDKVTLLSTLLQQIGVQSYYLLVNTHRGIVTSGTPANPYFNHAIIAVALPGNLEDPSLEAILVHPKLGRLLIFDPTNPLTPLGSLSGALQDNYALLVAGEGSELVKLPELPPASNSITRTAKLSLDENGTLSGDVHEVRTGDRADQQRFALRSVATDTDRIKPIETVVAASLSTYQITKASIRNLRAPEKPFEWFYSVDAEHYARTAGDLLLVRPRVIGTKSQAFLEVKEQRKHSIEYEGPEHDTDAFDISLPAGFEVDSLPPAADFDNGFVAYHSKTKVVGRTLTYMREYDVNKLSIPVEKAAELKAFYRLIDTDERSEVVLKPTAR
jgi:hypothetical protein